MEVCVGGPLFSKAPTPLEGSGTSKVSMGVRSARTLVTLLVTLLITIITYN